jgi:hypothetical protein
VLTEAQIVALERAKTEKEAHGEFESEHPGYCGAQDTFYVGNLKGVGRVYQQTFIDTYAKVACAKLYDRKTPITAALLERLAQYSRRYRLPYRIVEIPAHLAPGTSGLKAFAVRAPEGTLRVCLINQNIALDERLAIDPGRKFTAASMLRLAGPAIDATAGVTFGPCER